LGNISEDVLKDSRLFFENGLPGPEGTASASRRTDNSSWGKVPRMAPIIRALDNDPATRSSQDVGFDGLSHDEEKAHYQSYINAITAAGGTPDLLSKVQADPSSDNFEFFNSNSLGPNATVLERYREFNQPGGNSPLNQNTHSVQSP